MTSVTTEQKSFMSILLIDMLIWKIQQHVWHNGTLKRANIRMWYIFSGFSSQFISYLNISMNEIHAHHFLGFPQCILHLIIATYVIGGLVPIFCIQIMHILLAQWMSRVTYLVGWPILPSFLTSYQWQSRLYLYITTSN